MEGVSREACRELLGRRITIDGTDFALTISECQCQTIYLPLACLVLQRAEQRKSGRFVTGIAGPPGAGKSVTAAILAELMGILLSPERVAVVPLDGFHYPNSYLDSHTAEDCGTTGTLRSFKGRPCSFDGEGALAALCSVRDGERVSLPVYSRRLHDPAEDALRLGVETDIVLVEGNFLYLDRSPWSEMRGLFDLRVFITEARDTLERRLVERHRRGGASFEEARNKVMRVDAVNVDEVAPSESHADVVLFPAECRLEIRQ